MMGWVCGFHVRRTQEHVATASSDRTRRIQWRIHVNYWPGCCNRWLLEGSKWFPHTTCRQRQHLPGVCVCVSLCVCVTGESTDHNTLPPMRSGRRAGEGSGALHRSQATEPDSDGSLRRSQGNTKSDKRDVFDMLIMLSIFFNHDVCSNIRM